MYFLNTQDVIRLNRRLMEQTSEHFAILFYGTLEGCIEKIQKILFGVELYPGIYEKAAVLMQCIITRCPFENGNKRTGIATAITFLEMNGIIIDVDIAESVEFCKEIARSQIEMSEIAKWLKTHTRQPTYRV